VSAPTYVLHFSANQLFTLDHGEYLASHVEEARLVVLGGPAGNFLFSAEAGDLVVTHIEEVLRGSLPERHMDSALATVLFTDIVSSTEHAVTLGDRKWAHILDQHDAIVDEELGRHRGRKVNPAGDGVLAIFDGPVRAIRCARAICSAVTGLGIEVRAGVHTGEVQHRGHDIGGIAVHVGARISALAGPGEVLVSSTVGDLVTGSGISFDDRGAHELKGVPGVWRVLAVNGP
jgi:class 3 adenylate cyclase